jgi:dethiobiotin synthetase
MTVYFVTGTDTEVGKTVVTAALVAILRARRKNVAVVKPAQTGVQPGEPGDVDEVRRLAGPVDARDRHDLASHTGVPVLGAVPEGASALSPSDFQAQVLDWIKTDCRPTRADARSRWCRQHNWIR